MLATPPSGTQFWVTKLVVMLSRCWKLQKIWMNNLIKLVQQLNTNE